MGDTGSLVIGLLIAILVVKFNEFNIIAQSPFAIGAAPVVSFAAVAIPLIDMLRVITIRLLDGRSPFVADNHHLHHRILSLQPNHFKVTVIMVSANVLFVLAALLSNYLSIDVNIQFVIIFLFALLISYIPSLLIHVRKIGFKEGSFVRQYD
jgi:UDP-N-acetylmuramyl pentapeptide phosphotransferase/UDP-N-acetylglucosamine-1-phosphate transferase